MASAAYFLPTAQSVPTVSSRLPRRLRPVPVRRSLGARRTSTSRLPERAAASATAGRLPSGVCMPLATSKPSSSACASVACQVSGSRPPGLTAPTTSVRAPRLPASGTDSSDTPRSAPQPRSRHWPTTRSGRQSTMPWPVLAASASLASPRKIKYGASILCTGEGFPLLAQAAPRFDDIHRPYHCRSVSERLEGLGRAIAFWPWCQRSMKA